MNIQEQIKEKENMIENLKNEIEQLRKDNIYEMTKDYQQYMGKYFKVNSDYYIKTKTIMNENSYYCISAYYDDTYNSFSLDNDIENLITLDHVEEITEQEFLNFINGKIMEIIK